MDINDQDIDILLLEQNIKDFLDCVSDETFGNHKILVNLLLFLFYSESTRKEDWIQDIIYVIENKIFDESYLAPCVKEHLKQNKKIIDNIKKAAEVLKSNGYIEVHNYYITYEMFNDYIHNLYDWCKETFEIV